MDRNNELLEQILRNPKSAQPGGMDQFHRLIDSLEHVLHAHPRTMIVGAHGTYTENLSKVSSLLDQYSNFHIDIAWAAHQLGRQPRAAQSLILRHSRRVLFGTDVFPVRLSNYHAYFRFLQTADEAFPVFRRARTPLGPVADLRA